MRPIFLMIFALTAFSTVAAAATKPIRFWNLTTKTVTSLELAKAGTSNFGADLCKGDKDGSVDYDERLNLSSVVPGSYDVKVGYASGRTCIVKKVNIQTGKVFSIDDRDLTACTK
ncbi:MAG TPA: hypothetical protein VIJ06_02730 [Methylovirgula sp.]